jgi:hypothetical protein
MASGERKFNALLGQLFGQLEHVAVGASEPVDHHPVDVGNPIQYPEGVARLHS